MTITIDQLEDGKSFGVQRGKINANLEALNTDKASNDTILTLDNVYVYNPSGTYHPCTKKYADDLYASILSVYDPTSISANAFDRANHTGTQWPASIATNDDYQFVSLAQVTSWTAKEPAIGAKGTAFNKNFGVTANDVPMGNHSHTAGDLGLGQVNNTSDVDKPVSTATQAELDLKASLTQLALTYTQTQVDALLALLRPLSNMQFGDVAGGDYTEFLADGTMIMHGAATVWDDITASLIGRNLSSSAGSVDYNWDENAIAFSPSGSIAASGDRLAWNDQLTHRVLSGSSYHVHIHWEQTDAVAREFTLEYRIQNNGNAKQQTWTQLIIDTTTDPVFPWSAGTLNQITELAIIDLTGVSISAIIEFRMTRTDSETGDILATSIDGHVEMDRLGSGDEYTT